MALKRLVVLLSVLLAAVGLLLTKTYWEPLINGHDPLPPIAKVPPLAGRNAVDKLAINQDAKGRWMVTIDYFFTGEPAGARLLIRLPREAAATNISASAPSSYSNMSSSLMPKRGQQRVTHELNKPGFEGSTHFVVAELVGVDNLALSRQQIPQTIDWPDWHTWSLVRSLREQSTPQLLERAVGMIDSGQAGELRDAKFILERLIAGDPKLDPAYVELARVAMKTNWGPEGLHQAESLLSSALNIRPDSVNAKILQGYVFAHQKRYREAEALFTESAAADPPNVWLWANWGELLVMQGMSWSLYWLATSEHTMVAAKKLIATGESVEQLDNQKMNALGYALQAQDHEATRRLLRLGARPDAEIGEYAMPVALLPVVESDLAGVRIMQKAGVNYARLRYRGATALDHAKRTGNQPLMDALVPRGNTF